MKKNIRLLFFIFGLDFSQGLDPSGTTLRLAINDELVDSPPYIETMNYAKEALRHLNIKIEYVPLPLARGALMANQGLLDGELIRSRLVPGEYENLIETKEPLIDSFYGIVHISGEQFNVSTIRKKKGVIPLNVRGVESFIQRLELQVVGVPSIERALDMVVSKRADYAIIEQRVFESIKLKDPRYANMTFAKDLSISNPLYLRVNKKFSNILLRLKTPSKRKKG